MFVVVQYIHNWLIYHYINTLCRSKYSLLIVSECLREKKRSAVAGQPLCYKVFKRIYFRYFSISESGTRLYDIGIPNVASVRLLSVNCMISVVVVIMSLPLIIIVFPERFH